MLKGWKNLISSALLVGSGTVKKSIDLSKYDYKVAVDGGADFFFKLETTPDLIIGDLDSCKEKVVNHFRKLKIPIQKFSSEKDYTDMDLAIDRIISLGCDNITILGATGSRIDHMLGNIYLLLKYKNKAFIRILDNNNLVYLCRKKEIINKGDYKYFSLLALSDEVTKVQVKGSKYELSGKTLYNDVLLGISNEFKEDKVLISYEEGDLLLIQSMD